MAGALFGRSNSRSSYSSIRISEARIYGPSNLGLEDGELVADRQLKREEIRSRLLAKIERCYERVKAFKGVQDAGFCFGLLDPVSNIVVGVLIACVVKEVPADDKVVSLPPPLTKPDRIGDMKKRSLNGLIAFLVALFPSLTNTRAMWYLNKAELDPLVAALLIIKHRGMEAGFGFASDTTVAAVETAIRCAAAAAQHPNPPIFAFGWKLLSPFLKEAATVVSNHYITSDRSQFLGIIDILLRGSPVVFSLETSWTLAYSRLLKLRPDLLRFKELKVFPERSTVRRVLLTTIHGYYLQALARLPKDKLRSHYHHSLLHAGHCYGPLDPVSNILLNTIWYSRAYPPLTENAAVEIKAISTAGLLRIAVRSFYGLVSFLCTRYARLDLEEAMQRLQATGANLRLAFPNLLDDDHNHDAVVSAPVEEAYAAAAAAALHPKPHHQVELLRPSNPMLRMAADYLKEDAGALSHEDADRLSESLFYSFPISKSEQQEQAETSIMVLDQWTYNHEAKENIDDFWNQHTRVVRMVESAIDIYSQQHGAPKYELHVICGVNELVDGPVYTTPFTPTYHCSHINFLATQSAGAPPTLFFAECRNDGSEVGLCCPVSVPLPDTEQVRCLYCEIRGSRIVHPSKGRFQGRDREFEQMLCGEGLYSDWYTNDRIISCSHPVTYSVNFLGDDCIYRVYRIDNKDEKSLSDKDFLCMF